MGKSITLNEETVKAVNAYAAGYTPDESHDFCDLEDVEFQQDGFDIFVGIHIDGHWNYWTEKHKEVPPPNEEYFSEWAYAGHDITSVNAYDTDGEEVEITNREELLGL